MKIFLKSTNANLLKSFSGSGNIGENFRGPLENCSQNPRGFENFSLKSAIFKNKIKISNLLKTCSPKS